MKRKIIGIAVALAFVALPVAVKLSNAGAVRPAQLGKVELKQIQPSILATGNLVFRQEVQLTSEVIGRVSEVLVKEGDRVTRGQVLLRLDPTLYRSEVQQHEATRRSAQIEVERAQLNVINQQRNLDRAKQLAQAKFIDASRLDDASHQMKLAQIQARVNEETLQQAQATVSLVRERLAKTEVRAPIDGTATAVQIKIGETAVASVTGMPGSSLMTIADVGSIMAEVNVDEADVAGVHAGQRARVFPSAFPERPLDGTVETVSLAPKVGAQGRSYIVKLRLDDSALALRTGMTCRVEIVTGGGPPRPGVPLQAILAEQGERDKGSTRDRSAPTNFVLAVIDGKIRKQPVELGLADDNNREVLAGLPVGAAIAVGPARTLRELREGDRVASPEAASGSAPASAPAVAARPAQHAARANPRANLP